MSIIGWVILGLISGFLASKLINKEGANLLVDVVLGMVGALIAGLLYMNADAIGINLVTVYSLIVAIVGSMLVLFTYHRILKH